MPQELSLELQEHSKIRILIRSPRNLSSESLKAAIGSHERFESVQLAETDDEMLDELEHNNILLMVFDPRDSLEKLTSILERIRLRKLNVRVIVLMEQRDRDLVIRAFNRGARGVLCPRSSGLEDLWKCIAKVHEGQIWANSEELEWVMSAFENRLDVHKPKPLVNALGTKLLSKREEDVVELLVDGMQNREIAQMLGLSEHTVKNYLFRIYDKLGISTRSELMLYVLTPRERTAS